MTDTNPFSQSLRRCPGYTLSAVEHERIADEIDRLTAQLEQWQAVVGDVIGWAYAWEDNINPHALDRLHEIIKPEALPQSTKNTAPNTPYEGTSVNDGPGSITPSERDDGEIVSQPLPTKGSDS